MAVLPDAFHRTCFYCCGDLKAQCHFVVSWLKSFLCDSGRRRPACGRLAWESCGRLAWGSESIGANHLSFQGPFSKVVDRHVSNPWLRRLLDLECFVLSGMEAKDTIAAEMAFM